MRTEQFWNKVDNVAESGRKAGFPGKTGRWEEENITSFTPFLTALMRITVTFLLKTQVKPVGRRIFLFVKN